MKYLIHLADHYNLSFTSDVFPSVLKIVKVVVVYRKYSKLDPIFLLSNRRVGVMETGGMTTEYEFMYLKCSSCLNLVGTFFVIVHFESGGFMKIL